MLITSTSTSIQHHNSASQELLHVTNNSVLSAEIRNGIAYTVHIFFIYYQTWKYIVNICIILLLVIYCKGPASIYVDNFADQYVVRTMPL